MVAAQDGRIERRFTADGTSLGDVGLVDLQLEVLNQLYPSLAVGPSGTRLVAYVES